MRLFFYNKYLNTIIIKLLYFILFIIWYIFIVLIDSALIIPYLLFIYAYLLSPIYYIILFFIGWMRFWVPILIIYFFLCYYTINYSGYKIFKFFGVYLAPLKIELKYLKIRYMFLYELEYFHVYNILFLLLLSYCLFKEIFILGFILFFYINIYFLIKLDKYFKNDNFKNSISINILLLCLIYLYFQSFISINNSLNKSDMDVIQSSIWELFYFRLCNRYKHEENETKIFNNYMNNRKSYSFLKLKKEYDNLYSSKFNLFDKLNNIEDFRYRIDIEDSNIENNNIDLKNLDIINKEYNELLEKSKVLKVHPLKEGYHYRNYKTFRKYINEELDTSVFFLPLGEKKVEVESIFDIFKIDLRELYTFDDELIGKLPEYEDQNKDQDISNYYKRKLIYNNYLYQNNQDTFKNFLKFYLINKDNVFSNNKYYYNKQLNSLYYNKEKFGSNLHNFLIKYYNNEDTYNHPYNQSLNELFIDLTIFEQKSIKKSKGKRFHFQETHSFARAFDTVFTANYEDSKEWIGKSFDYDKYFNESDEFKRGDITSLRLYESNLNDDKIYYLSQKLLNKNINLQYYYSLLYLYNDKDKQRLLDQYRNADVPNIFMSFDEKVDEDEDENIVV